MPTVKDRTDPKFLEDLAAEIVRFNKPDDFMYVDVLKELGETEYYVAAYNMFQGGCSLDKAASALLERAADLHRLRSPEWTRNTA